MPPRNPFGGNGNEPPERTKGEKITNMRKERITRILGPDGRPLYTPMSVRDVRPGPDGTLVDSELKDIIHDRAGNPLPEDPRSTVLSHSGLFINSPEKMATCTYRLHGNGPANILIGQDGRLTPNGAICSRCESLRNTICIAGIILGIAVLMGVWQGAGNF